jgi:hypothetical protein
MKTGPEAGREGIYLGRGPDIPSNSTRGQRRRREPMRQAGVEFPDRVQTVPYDWIEPVEAGDE